MKSVFLAPGRILTLLLFTMCFSVVAYGQSGSDEDPRLINFFELSVDPVNPIYSFGERLDKNLLGFSLAYLRQRKKTRLDYFGAQLSYTHVGSISASFFDADIRTSTELINLKFLYRYFPDFFFWRIEPFVELGFGPQVIYTLTTNTFFLDDTTTLVFEESDFGLAYHVGVGFTTHIAGQVFFLSKFNFNGGTSMSYSVPGEYDSGLPIDNFFSETSSINYINWQLGLTISF